jgi:predicted nucleotidyltransferase
MTASNVESSAVQLAASVQRVLADLVEAARRCFRDDLKSIVLFGSGAEGRLRATSDLNLLFVLARFDKNQVDAFREPLRVAHVAARVMAMFVLESELPAAAEAFAVKFDDMGRRRRVLFGADPIAGLSISRAAKKQRLCQILMNVTLRLRERYAATSLREERLAIIIAEAAGPLRSAAATLLELEGRPAASPKHALEQVAGSLAGPSWIPTLEQMSKARESRRLPAGTAAPVMFQLLALAEALRQRAERTD